MIIIEEPVQVCFVIFEVLYGSQRLNL